LANVPIVGLSATPWARGLGKHFESLLIAATTSDLIEQGYLSPFRVFATGHPDLGGVKMVAGDYHEGQLSDAMQEGELTADIIRKHGRRSGARTRRCALRSIRPTRVRSRSGSSRQAWPAAIRTPARRRKSGAISAEVSQRRVSGCRQHPDADDGR
jgi:superfamily II DNA or RNA helicase